LSRSDKPGEPLRPAEMRQYPALELREGECSAAPRHADIAGQRQFESLVAGVAVEDSDGGLREGGEGFDETGVYRVVEALAEMRAGAGQGEAEDRIVILDSCCKFEQLVRHPRVEPIGRRR